VNRLNLVALSCVFVFVLHGCVSVPDHTEMAVCDNTPECPAKHACVQRLLPSVKNTIYGYASLDNTYWEDHYLAWSEYLGERGADYTRIEEIRSTVQRGIRLRLDNSDTPDNGYFALAGYYDGLGSQWKMYSNRAKVVGQFCILNCQD
jgi:hypothetical protein